MSKSIAAKRVRTKPTAVKSSSHKPAPPKEARNVAVKGASKAAAAAGTKTVSKMVATTLAKAGASEAALATQAPRGQRLEAIRRATGTASLTGGRHHTSGGAERELVRLTDRPATDERRKWKRFASPDAQQVKAGLALAGQPPRDALVVNESYGGACLAVADISGLDTDARVTVSYYGGQQPAVVRYVSHAGRDHQWHVGVEWCELPLDA
jgi:hypothetical protein